MGVVFRGEHPATGRPCALKVLQEVPAEADRIRFLREAKLCARVRHPNLVEVLEMGEEGGVPWLAMELVEGRNLQRLVEKQGPFEPGRALEVVAEVAGALEALHDAGVLHRDVKPSNVVLDRGGRCVLMDLGLALEIDATRITATNVVGGTLGYLAPEALLARDVGPGLDWYALGVTLTYLLTGKRPFGSRQIFAMMKAQEWRDPPELPLPPEGADAARLVRAWMAVDPGRRPAGVEAMRRVLAGAEVAPGEAAPEEAAPEEPAAAAGEEDEPAPPPPGPAPAPRRRLGGLVALGLGAALVGTVVSNRRTRTPAAPRPTTPPPAARPAPVPSPTGSPRYPALQGLLGRLGFPRCDEPHMVLEMVFYRQEGDRATRARALLDRLPASPSVRYFQVRSHEHRGEADRILAMTGDGDLGAPATDYWEAKVRMKRLEARMREAGPRVEGAREEDRARLRADLRSFDAALEASRDSALRLLRAEFWDRLARRLQGRPLVDFSALEFADHLLAEVQGDLPRDAGYLRAQALLLASRFAGHLGDLPRFRAQLAAREEAVLAPVDAVPEAREYWSFRIREDGEKLLEPGPLSLFTRPTIATPTPGWLPYPAGWPGSAAFGTRPPPVPDPPAREPLVIPGPGDAGPVEDLAAWGDRARVTRRPLRAAPPWLEAAAAALRPAPGDPLVEALASWPEILVALRGPMEARARGGEYVELLRVADRAQRSAKGYTAARRSRYRGAWAALHLARLEAEERHGDPAAALDDVRRYLRGFARFAPPWCETEVGTLVRIRDWLARVSGPEGACSGLCAEVGALEALQVGSASSLAPRPTR